MDVKITQQKDNALMARKDIRFAVAHPGETTPSRTQVRQLVAAQVGTKTENVVIESMETEYGIGRTSGVARAYKSPDEARKTERTHLLKRNSLYVEKAKKGAKEGEGEKKDEKAAPAAKPAAAPAAKPAAPAAAKPAAAPAKKEA